MILTALKVHSLKNQAVIADTVIVAESFRDRLFGLIGHSRLEPRSGMLFRNCNSIHMWFMRFSIDVVFLGKEDRVSSVHRSVRAWRLLPLNDFKAQHCLELPEGTIDRCAIQAGDQLCLS